MAQAIATQAIPFRDHPERLYLVGLSTVMQHRSIQIKSSELIWILRRRDEKCYSRCCCPGRTDCHTVRDDMKESFQ